MKLPPRLAAAFSFHPDPHFKEDPRYQRNNPANANALMPTQILSGTPYMEDDNKVARPVDGVTITPMAQQQVIMRPPGSMPGGDNPAVPGNPDLIAPSPLLQQIGDLAATTTAMAGSQQRPMGDPQAAMRRGMPGRLAMGQSQGPSGFSTSRVGGHRPLNAWGTRR
jgi:hypothetical protein